MNYAREQPPLRNYFPISSILLTCHGHIELSLYTHCNDMHCYHTSYSELASYKLLTNTVILAAGASSSWHSSTVFLLHVWSLLL